MAVTCDRCLGKDAHSVDVVFRKKDKYKGKGSSNPRQILAAPMDLCETCITEFLRSFGKWKVKWMKEADEPDPKVSNEQQSHQG